MSWILTITKGPQRGEKFPVRDGMIIGRKGADVVLNDRRVSGRHAVVRRSGDSWELHDNGSKNGIKDARGNSIETLRLIPRLTFSIGETTFEADRTDDQGVDLGPDADAAPRQTWYDVLARMLNQNAERFRDQPRALIPFEPALTLNFVRGAQVSARWILGYGPRRVGPGALDLPLWEKDIPPVCFELVPGADGIHIRTEHQDLVRLNGRTVNNDKLQVGDTIQINETLIEVDFSE